MHRTRLAGAANAQIELSFALNPGFQAADWPTLSTNRKRVQMIIEIFEKPPEVTDISFVITIYKYLRRVSF